VQIHAKRSITWRASPTASRTAGECNSGPPCGGGLQERAGRGASRWRADRLPAACAIGDHVLRPRSRASQMFTKIAQLLRSGPSRPCVLDRISSRPRVWRFMSRPGFALRLVPIHGQLFFWQLEQCRKYGRVNNQLTPGISITNGPRRGNGISHLFGTLRCKSARRRDWLARSGEALKQFIYRHEHQRRFDHASLNSATKSSDCMLQLHPPQLEVTARGRDRFFRRCLTIRYRSGSAVSVPVTLAGRVIVANKGPGTQCVAQVASRWDCIFCHRRAYRRKAVPAKGLILRLQSKTLTAAASTAPKAVCWTERLLWVLSLRCGQQRPLQRCGPSRSWLKAVRAWPFTVLPFITGQCTVD